MSTDRLAPIRVAAVSGWRAFAALACLALACLVLLPRAAHAADLLDGNEDFKLLSELGFEQAVDGAHALGTRTNDYMWSMSWFKGKLYVGTGRFEIDPASNQPRPAQIWRYTPGGADGRSGTWERVFESPAFPGGGAREFGYRWMTQCSFEGNDYLFISTIGTLQGNILFTSDGVTFTPVPRAGFPANTVGFRTMVCFTEAGVRPMLLTTPVGKSGDVNTFDPDRSDNPIVLSNMSPATNTSWREYSPMRMGDPNNNASIFTMYTNGTFVYAGVGNEVSGGQLWRTSGCPAQLPFCIPTWTKMLDRGGGRPKTAGGIVQNAGFADMMQYNGDLYLAMSAPGLDGNSIRAELLRLRSDNTFEVLIGEPRMDGGWIRNGQPTSPNLPTNLRCGVALENINGVGAADDCPPTTRRGPGYGVIGNAATGYPVGPQFYFWRLFNYVYHPINAPKGDNRLYLGAAQGTTDPFSPTGFDMFVTTNGVSWSTVTGDGFGSIQQQGLRSIATTPYGLAVGGTHFPYPPDYPAPGPEIRGGNVWMGVPTVISDAIPPVTALTTPPSPAEGATLTTRNVSLAWTATDAPGSGSLPLTYSYRLDPLEAAMSAFVSPTSKTYSNLANGTYTFYVVARDAAGNTEALGAGRSFTIAAPDLVPTVAISSAPANPSASGNVAFSWVGSDDVTPAGSLTYDRWLSPLEADPATFAAGTTKGYTGLAEGPYTFHVIAKDGAGNVSTEASYSFTVVVPVAPPASPAPVSMAIVAARTVRIGWSNVAGESRYEIERCTSARSCAFTPLVANIAADTVSYDNVVPAAGFYAYRVRACNASGCSAWVQTNGLNVP